MKVIWSIELVLLALLTLIQPLQAKDWSKDPQAAVQLAAEQGDADAQFNLGVRYVNGRGVSQDDQQAMTWYRQAAKKGHAKAQFNLGVAYANGQGVPQDYGQAVAWYRQAAEQGHADAQFALGGMYYGGEGGPQDYLQAYAWLSVAAANGAVDAVKHRDILAQKLSQTQFAEAQVLATRYFEHSRPK